MILKLLARHRDNLILASIISLGLGLRILALLQSGSLWFDEIMAADIARQPIAEIWQLLKIENNPPLYFILLHWWGGIFSFSDQAVRILSIIASTASIPALYYLSKAIINKRVALLSALILAVTPYAIFIGVEARMYSLLLFFSIFSFLYFWRWLETGRRKYEILYLLFTLAALYTHLTAVTILAVQGIYLLAFKENRSKVKYFIFHIIILILALTPWLAGFIAEKISLIGNDSLANGWYFAKLTAFPVFFYQPVMVFFSNSFTSFGDINFLATLYYLLIWFMAGFAVCSLLFKYLINKPLVHELRVLVYVSLMAFLPGIGSSLTFNITNYRYYLTSLIGLIILFAAGLEKILLLKERHKNFKFISVSFIGILFYLAIAYSTYNHGAIKDIANYAVDHQVKTIVTGPIGSAIVYYLPENHSVDMIYLNRFLEKNPENISRLAYALKYNWNWDQWREFNEEELVFLKLQIIKLADDNVEEFSFFSSYNLISSAIIKLLKAQNYCPIDIYQPKTYETFNLIHFVKNKGEICPENLLIKE